MRSLKSAAFHLRTGPKMHYVSEFTQTAQDQIENLRSRVGQTN